MQERHVDAWGLGETVGTLRLGPPQQCANLVMFALLQPDGSRDTARGYCLLDDALAAGTARITEISTAGSVPELQLENSGAEAVLLLDGEELVGAKQNRVLNLTVLAPPHQTIRIPVSCVEAGRWSHQTIEFAAAPRAYYATGRAKKASDVSASLRTSGARHSDQSEVWADIAAKSERLAADSPTGAMAALFEHRATSLDTFVAALPPTEGQVGALFMIGSRPAGVDLFDHPLTLAALLPKLVRSYALDALDVAALDAAAGAPTAPPEPEAALGLAERFLRDLEQARGERYPAIGLGEDLRLHGERLTGGALLWSERLIHLGAFPVAQHAASPAGQARRTRLARPSRRARRD